MPTPPAHFLVGLMPLLASTASALLATVKTATACCGNVWKVCKALVS